VRHGFDGVWRLGWRGQVSDLEKMKRLEKENVELKERLAAIQKELIEIKTRENRWKKFPLNSAFEYLIEMTKL
jgi:aminoglycoside phosphotransferase family enzyme